MTGLDTPDFQYLADTSVWPLAIWSDAWVTLKTGHWDPTAIESIWRVTVDLGHVSRPDRTVDALLALLSS